MGTLQKLRSMLAQVIDVAMRRRLVSVNVARLAKLPPTGKAAKAGKSLTHDEVVALLDALTDEQLYLYVELAITTGARPGELFALTWDRVDFDENALTIAATKTGTWRRLRIAPSIMERVAQHHEQQRWNTDHLGIPNALHLVFTSSAGTPWDRSNVLRQLRRAARSAGIKSLNLYTLRHTAGSLLAARGALPQEIAERLGHRDSRTTSRYYLHPVTPIVEVGGDFTIGD